MWSSGFILCRGVSHFLDFGDCFFSQVTEAFSYVFKHILRPFVSHFFWYPCNANISALDIAPEVFSIIPISFHSLFSTVAGISSTVTGISTPLPSSSLIHFSVSFTLRLHLSSVFFLSVIVFFIPGLLKIIFFLLKASLCIHSSSEFFEYL